MNVVTAFEEIRFIFFFMSVGIKNRVSPCYPLNGLKYSISIVFLHPS